MNQPQRDFINITTAPAPAVNHLAADILTGQPTTLPGPDDALQTLSLYRGLQDADATDAEIRAEIAADGDYSPPAGIPDAYRTTDTYRPSQGIVDALGPSPLERLEMANGQRVRMVKGGRAQWQQDAEAIDADERADFAAWIGGTLREIACGFGIVAFVAAAAWLLFRAVTGGGQ